MPYWTWSPGATVVPSIAESDDGRFALWYNRPVPPGNERGTMKIVDSVASSVWQYRPRPGVPQASETIGKDGALASKLREFHRVTTIRTPAMSGFYAEGRAQVREYIEGFRDIRDVARNYAGRVQNARMTDAQIEALIERMNTMPR